MVSSAAAFLVSPVRNVASGAPGHAGAPFGKAVFNYSERRVLSLIDRGEKQLQNVILNAFTSAKLESGNLNELADIISRGRFDDAIERASRIAGLRIADGHAAVYTVAGESASQAMEDVLDVSVGFDRVNQRAVDYMQGERLRILEGITRTQREATRTAMVQGIREGVNPVEQARRFRDSIGLTEYQQGAVKKYRLALERANEGSNEALRRSLRDRRFDRSIERASGGGRPLGRAEIDRMVTRYRERYVKYRSQVIARDRIAPRRTRRKQ